MFTAKDAVKDLVSGFRANSHWPQVIWKCFNAGEYQIRQVSEREKPQDEYDENDNQICWGWLKSGDQTKEIVATFAHGERGNEPYDKWDDGLVIFFGNIDAEQNAKIDRAAKELVSKRIGFSEFKRIVRENS